MFITIEMTADKPIYLQLKEQIIEGIAKKELLPGDDLPSVRSLAQDIGINMQTVNKVYQQLKQEGFIQIHRKRGVVIHPDGAPKVDTTHTAEMKESLRPLLAESVARGMTEATFNQLVADVYDDIFHKEGADK